ncbi:MAG: methyl-accepting chemotaxis protein [Treponema sp.]|jgi:methyl-accepting chemotaxis protein|nr:methyl-accepting chemotaxis protein [Treponema sp.]
MNLKITTRLTISAAVFLLPVGIMLYSIISISLASIKKEQKELQGIEVLRPAVSLMQIIPHYVRLSIDNTPGNINFSRQYSSDLLGELNDKYALYFGEEYSVVSMQVLAENMDHLLNTVIRDTTLWANRQTVLWAYRQIMEDINKLIVYVGDISGLITDSEMEGAYLFTAAAHELPNTQERLVIIENLLRTIEDGAFTERRKADLQLQLEILFYSDNARIQNRFNSAEALRMWNTETLESFKLLLKSCYDNIAYFSQAVEYVISELSFDANALSSLFEISSHANDAAYRLQIASLDRLEELITGRINSHRLRLILSLAAAVSATFIAFCIIIFTSLSIRNSAVTIGKVFSRLDDNDLSVQLESSSRDELGELMTALGNFLNKLNTDFLSFNQNALMVTTAVLELSSSAKEITATANEQSASVAEIVSTMENNKNLSSQSSEKTVEVANLAVQTQGLSRRGADLRDINEGMMLDIRNQNAKIIEIIRNLADMLSRIDESIQLIDTIADRTKLIAFNAALEASSSGEAGSRFSVVAGEIRRFADNVVESAAEIKEKILELQEASQMLITEADNGSRAISEGYNRMVEQKEVFENIVDVSQNVADRSQEISSLSKQQEIASAQVFAALKEISAGVNHFVSSTALTSATVDKLNSMSVELKETLAKYQTENRGNV